MACPPEAGVVVGDVHPNSQGTMEGGGAWTGRWTVEAKVRVYRNGINFAVDMERQKQFNGVTLSVSLLVLLEE